MKKTQPKLDKYEQSIEKDIESGQYISDKDSNFTDLLRKAAKRHLELQETKAVTIRINKLDLIRIKAKAEKSHIPYQRLINLLIRQYVQGDTKISI